MTGTDPGSRVKGRQPRPWNPTVDELRVLRKVAKLDLMRRVVELEQRVWGMRRERAERARAEN